MWNYIFLKGIILNFFASFISMLVYNIIYYITHYPLICLSLKGPFMMFRQESTTAAVFASLDIKINQVIYWLICLAKLHWDIVIFICNLLLSQMFNTKQYITLSINITIDWLIDWLLLLLLLEREREREREMEWQFHISIWLFSFLPISQICVAHSNCRKS